MGKRSKERRLAETAGRRKQTIQLGGIARRSAPSYDQDEPYSQAAPLRATKVSGIGLLGAYREESDDDSEAENPFIVQKSQNLALPAARQPERKMEDQLAGFLAEINAIGDDTTSKSSDQTSTSTRLSAVYDQYNFDPFTQAHLLPHPWQAVLDESSGYHYYWNCETNEVQWEPPPAPATTVAPLPDPPPPPLLPGPSQSDDAEQVEEVQPEGPSLEEFEAIEEERRRKEMSAKLAGLSKKERIKLLLEKNNLNVEEKANDVTKEQDEGLENVRENAEDIAIKDGSDRKLEGDSNDKPKLNQGNLSSLVLGYDSDASDNESPNLSVDSKMIVNREEEEGGPSKLSNAALADMEDLFNEADNLGKNQGDETKTDNVLNRRDKDEEMVDESVSDGVTNENEETSNQQDKESTGMVVLEEEASDLKDQNYVSKEEENEEEEDLDDLVIMSRYDLQEVDDEDQEKKGEKNDENEVDDDKDVVKKTEADVVEKVTPVDEEEIAEKDTQPSPVGDKETDDAAGKKEKEFMVDMFAEESEHEEEAVGEAVTEEKAKVTVDDKAVKDDAKETVLDESKNDGKSGEEGDGGKGKSSETGKKKKDLKEEEKKSRHKEKKNKKKKEKDKEKDREKEKKDKKHKDDDKKHKDVERKRKESERKRRTEKEEKKSEKGEDKRKKKHSDDGPSKHSRKSKDSQKEVKKKELTAEEKLKIEEERRKAVQEEIEREERKRSEYERLKKKEKIRKEEEQKKMDQLKKEEEKKKEKEISDFAEMLLEGALDGDVPEPESNEQQKEEQKKETTEDMEISDNESEDNRPPLPPMPPPEDEPPIQGEAGQNAEVDDAMYYEQEEELSSRISDLSLLLFDKLEFLDVSKKGLTNFQILLIEMETRMSDWHEGALNTQYLLYKLEQIDAEITKYEETAAPDGWSCHWSSDHGMYYYYNEKTGESTWSYPGSTPGDASTAQASQSTAYQKTGVENSNAKPAAPIAAPLDSYGYGKSNMMMWRPDLVENEKKEDEKKKTEERLSDPYRDPYRKSSKKQETKPPSPEPVATTETLLPPGEDDDAVTNPFGDGMKSGTSSPLPLVTSAAVLPTAAALPTDTATVKPIGQAAAVKLPTDEIQSTATVVKEAVKISSIHRVASDSTLLVSHSLQAQQTAPVIQSGINAPQGKPEKKKKEKRKKLAAGGLPSKKLKTVSSLVQKWQQVKQKVDEEMMENSSEDEDPETAALKRIDEWKRAQIDSGRAAYNPNFEEIKGNWREKIKKKQS